MKPAEGQTPADLGVLFVSGVFPPVNTAGSFRLLRFTSWMSRAGWQVSVLTLQPGGGEPLDRSLLERLPAEIEVKTTRACYPLRWLARLKRSAAPQGRETGAGRAETPTDRKPAAGAGASIRSSIIDIFSVPDQDSGWWPIATWAGIRLARAKKIKAIVSSGPPHTSHLVALSIKVATGRPWVADLRDPWARATWAGRGKLASRLNQLAERLCVRRADRVVLNTPRLLADFRSFYADLAPAKFCCITNGFDEDLLGMARPPRDRTSAGGKRIRLTHAGNFYGNRNPTPLLEALRDLVQSGRMGAEELEIVLIGTSDEQLQLAERVKRMGLSEIVRLEPKVPHLEALEISAQSDVLLLIQQEAPLQTPSKLFEYMALKKPVLALTGAGSTADIVRQGNFGFAVSPDDHEGIKSALLAITSPDYCFAPDEEFMGQFSGERLSRDFERVVLKASSRKTASESAHWDA